ncbi:MAG: choline dehydrogenase [Gammaproteobacteria bacterium TMED30]|nr:choline dehydrogenase [Gammaproteobacteria bacterium]OUU00198.1 MAG: choline dehydrogenase [Gammaproteobacteria bacterium TMED30]
MTDSSNRRFDYIIVGAGTAGCVLANRLSQDPSKQVLLLEAGKKDNYFWIDVPVGYLYTIGNPRTDWCFETEAEAGLNGRSIGYARGKVLGGCSSINAMIYMRGQQSDYDHWAGLGNSGWGWQDVLPVFRRSESYQHGADDFHGGNGELRVEERRVNWEILDAWRDAAEECGIPKIDEFNRGDNFGNAYFQMNQRNGKRWSAVRAFLDPIKGRSNLTILTEASVREICFDDNPIEPTATGVKVRHDGHEQLFHANNEVILAAGAIASPQLLQLSGIGASEVLHKHDIQTLIELPGVGENLQDHLQIRTIYSVDNTVTLNQRARTPWGMALMGLEYFLRKTGPLTMPPSQLGAFAKSDPSQSTANIEWHVQPLSLDKFGSPLHKYNAITPSVCNVRPTSRGQISLRDRNPDSAPLIQPNYLSTAEDRATAVAGLKFTREIMAAPALAPFAPHELKPGAHLITDDDLAQAAGDLGTTIFHPVGTCKMGKDSMAVVDDQLRVRGVHRLRVVDASIMPTITSGNTNAPTVMIAEKGADFIRKNYRHSV